MVRTRTVCTVASDPHHPLQVLVNIVGDLLLCPHLGLVGAAAATSAAQAVLFGFLFFKLRARGLVPTDLFRVGGRDSWERIRKTTRMVLPTSLLTLMRTSLYAVLSFWCCQMGIVSAAAQQIAATMFWGSTGAAGEPMSAVAQSYVPARYEAWRVAAQQASDAAEMEDDKASVAAKLRLEQARQGLVTTIARLFRTSLFFGGAVLACVVHVTAAGPLQSFPPNALVIAQVPRWPLVAIAGICPFALLCEGTLLSFGARSELVRNLACGVSLSLGLGALLMSRGLGTVNSIWCVAAGFQVWRFLSNAFVLRQKMRAPPPI